MSAASAPSRSLLSTRRRTVTARRPAADRFARRRATRRLAATANRAGFTLIEMLIATTLVLLMMLLFAQVFGLATETVSTRKGMAANDQKARLLTTRIDNDLSARTFRVVAPFRGRTFDYTEERANVDIDGDGNPETVTIGWEKQQATSAIGPVYTTNGGTTPAQAAEVVKGSLEGRRGVFSISENDPMNDGDDVITFTIDRRTLKSRGGVVYSPALGRAAVLNTDGQLYSVSGGTVLANQPATDVFNTSGAEEGLDGGSPFFSTPIGTTALANSSPVGVSNYEVVTFFLRNGNLIRARKLVREATSDPDALWDTDADGSANEWPPAGQPAFGRYMDYATYSHPQTLSSAPSSYGPRLHSEASLENEVGGNEISADFNDDGFDDYRGPDALGNPYLREGAGFYPFNAAAGGRTQPFGRPREFRGRTFGPDSSFLAGGGITSADWGTAFLGRYTAQEQSQAVFNLPGRRPFDPSDFDPSDPLKSGPIFANDIAPYVATAAATTDRRGEEILLSNVHGFDIKVYDDAIGDFVDLGHSRTVTVKDIFNLTGDVTNDIQVAGDYHADRLVALTPMGDPALDVTGDTAGDISYDGTPGRDPHPFGNRFDTWHPGMTLMGVGFADTTGDGMGDTAVSIERPYPPPYRPLRNPFGGNVGFPTRDSGGNFVNPDLTFSGIGLVTAEDLDGGANFATTPVTTEDLLAAAPDGFLDDSLPTHSAPGGGSGGGYYAKGYADSDGDGVAELPARLFPDPNAYGAPGTGDEKPLRAVRITVRYYDVQSDQMREESFRHALTD
ncbi:prepilin-type N-terminal cleavage/methylation domain-containing protein [Alienimonas chondri]|uniref:Prepilin-type N-terminal cleavage/methylation domain-containing protein n=1 Tax=Alienimonas chondri TaxID=2681879 RepID=A0ABX1VBZ5_9PLAN|nr:prepilin-type N-terminal cleavage/methylation domain-containing protein [Alienimonas chondri]NNJ25630.1 hypothetical protein [Alienimonas chondri]